MKTMKQFTEEWNGRKEGAITVNRCFSFKSWLGDDRKVFVAAQYDDFSRTWEAVHAEYADNGEDIAKLVAKWEGAGQSDVYRVL